LAAVELDCLLDAMPCRPPRVIARAFWENSVLISLGCIAVTIASGEFRFPRAGSILKWGPGHDWYIQSHLWEVV
jgi:hypothetical protein